VSYAEIGIEDARNRIMRSGRRALNRRRYTASILPVREAPHELVASIGIRKMRECDESDEPGEWCETMKNALEPVKITFNLVFH
jgi:hypothetical protein